MYTNVFLNHCFHFVYFKIIQTQHRRPNNNNYMYTKNLTVKVTKTQIKIILMSGFLNRCARPPWFLVEKTWRQCHELKSNIILWAQSSACFWQKMYWKVCEFLSDVKCSRTHVARCQFVLLTWHYSLHKKIYNQQGIMIISKWHLWH